MTEAAGIALDAATVELLAELVAAKLDECHTARAGWVTADIVAAHLAVEVSYIYEHAVELGAVRLGDGPRARLRFRLDVVDKALAGGASCPSGRESGDARSGTVARKSRRRRGSGLGTGVELLPIRGVDRDAD